MKFDGSRRADARAAAGDGRSGVASGERRPGRSDAADTGRTALLYPLRKLGQLGPVCHRHDRREQRHERRLRDRVCRERWALPLAHTRPAGWAISIILYQASPGNGPDESADRSTAFEPVRESLLLP
jgi:hypothetical protein